MVPLYALIDRALRGTETLAKRSQEELAEQLSCSQQAVSAYLHGRTVPPDTKAGLFARTLGVAADDMLASLRRDRALTLHERERLARDHHAAVLAERITADAAGTP